LQGSVRFSELKVRFLLFRKAGHASSGSSTRSSSRTGSSGSSTASDSADEGGQNSPAFVLPPSDIQLIIDKMASYVLKNGRDFEVVVRSKGEEETNAKESHRGKDQSFLCPRSTLGICIGTWKGTLLSANITSSPDNGKAEKYVKH